MLANLPKKTRRVARKRIQTTVNRMASTDPVMTSVKAIIRPFDAPKGIASPLGGLTRSSQKFMAKGATSVVIPAGCKMVFMQAPCVASDATYQSLVIGVQTASATQMSGPWKNAVVGAKVVTGGTITMLSTNTPYSSSTLAGSGYEWQSVSSGIRFSYEGTVLNQSGTFRYIHDPENGYNQGFVDWTGKGPAEVISYIDAATNCIRQNIIKNPIVEINSTVVSMNGPSEGQTLWPNAFGSLIGGTTTNNMFSINPCLIGVFENTSTNSISFHVEIIEHWAVAGPNLQALHTDSVSHPVLLDQVSNFLQSSRQMHASTPNSHHTAVMKSVKQGIGSPLGHEVLNAALTAALA